MYTAEYWQAKAIVQRLACTQLIMFSLNAQALQCGCSATTARAAESHIMINI